MAFQASLYTFFKMGSFCTCLLFSLNFDFCLINKIVITLINKIVIYHVAFPDVAVVLACEIETDLKNSKSSFIQFKLEY